MRYSLRNKSKIESAYGEKFYKRLIDSLDQEFNNPNFNPELKEMEGEKYPVIDVNDAGHTCGLILFYVIRKTFDVYNLAFKEVIN